MADFKEFIIAPQDLSGFEKISEGLAAKQAAKAKADAEKKAASQEALKLTLTDLKPQDYLSNTLADKLILSDLQKAQEKAYKLSALGYDYNQIKLGISDDVNNLLQRQQAAKNTQAQLNTYLEANKGIKGIDYNKFREEMIKDAFIDPETGDVKQNIDPTKDYGSDVLMNKDVYTNEGFDERVRGTGKQTVKIKTNVRGNDGVVREKEMDIQLGAGFIPDYEKDAKTGKDVFVGVIPEHDKTTQVDNLDFMHKALGHTDTTSPLRMIPDEIHKNLTPVLQGKLNQDTRAFAKDFFSTYNKMPSNDQIIKFQKADAYDILKESSKNSFSYGESAKVQAPVIKSTTNVYTGKGGEDGAKYTGNVFDEIDLSQYTKENKKPIILNNKTIILKKGSAEYEDGTPVEKGTIRVDAADLPVSIEQLIKQIYPTYPLKDYAYLTIENGQISAVQYSDLDSSGKPVDKSTKITRQAIENIQTGQRKKMTKEKNVGEVIYGKEEKQTKKVSKLSSYPSDIQNAIKAYMNAKGISEEQAILNLKAANKIK